MIKNNIIYIIQLSISEYSSVYVWVLNGLKLQIYTYSLIERDLWGIYLRASMTTHEV
jgi:hypothetical protein